MEDILLSAIGTAGDLTPAVMAYFMFKQNQLLIRQKDKHEEELMKVVKDLINNKPLTNS